MSGALPWLVAIGCTVLGVAAGVGLTLYAVKKTLQRH
jgi:hypothetical protein